VPDWWYGHVPVGVARQDVAAELRRGLDDGARPQPARRSRLPVVLVALCTLLVLLGGVVAVVVA